MLSATAFITQTKVADRIVTIVLCFQLGLFRISCCFATITGLVAGNATAISNGLCDCNANNEESENNGCYYDVNYYANKAVSIATVCMMVADGILHMLLGCFRSEDAPPSSVTTTPLTKLFVL